jgi:hypothetical protein
MFVASDTQTKRETGHEAQLNNIQAAKVTHRTSFPHFLKQAQKITKK